MRREDRSKANLTAISWAHAVNSQQDLNQVLSSDVDMIEADVVLGQVNNSDPILPVMAHPPALISDLSLAEFLYRIMSHNQSHVNEMKGVKLDFKSIGAFQASLDMLHELMPKISYPIWLNADIVSGPVKPSDSQPVDPEPFIAGCARFKKAVLSIGWTTRWGANSTDGAYTPSEIDEMLQAIKNSNITTTEHSITFPVRAGIAANSREQLHRLVDAVTRTNDTSITIWSSKNDYVDIEKLRELIISFGFDRVYLDVPYELVCKLDMNRGAICRKLLPYDKRL